MAFWHPCHTLACWALGAHFGWGQQQMLYSLRPTHPQGPKCHWVGMPAACKPNTGSKISPNCQLWQKTINSKARVAKKCQHQQPTKKIARDTCGHALARIWRPGAMLQVWGLARWVPPGLMHFLGLGGISRKFPSLGGQHATLPMCLPPKLGAP